MHRVWICNALLTRKCNLNCSYCSIIRNPDPDTGYEKIKWFNDNEICVFDWIQIVERLRRNNPDCFFIWYGGEPTIYKDFEPLISFCNKTKVNYTVITNNTPYAVRKIRKVYEKCGQFRGLTGSVDPVALMSGNDDITLKSREGIDNLSKYIEDGVSEDVVAEMTITRESIPYVYPTVKYLSERGIYTSITAIDDKKSIYYDFSNVGSEVLLDATEELKSLFEKIRDEAEEGKLLVHMPDLLMKFYSVLPSRMKCSLVHSLHNVSIEPDGSFRLCLRIRGPRLVNDKFKNIDNIISPYGKFRDEFLKEFRMDYVNYCMGCNWTCPIMSDYFSEQIIDHG